MSRYRTVAGRSSFALDPIKGSRFLATVNTAADEAAAREVIAAVRAAHADARHHCWAWVLQCDEHRCSDDGEPGGSAGRPILAQIEGHGLEHTVVVVSRWFGGVKLGVGGLIRAYGGCAGKALDRADTVQVVPTERLSVEHEYPATASVDAVLGAHGLLRVDAVYATTVRFALEVPFDLVDQVKADLIDRTSGRVRFPLDTESSA